MNLWNNANHADNTWTHDTTKVNWVEDLLPAQIPNARIMAYEYNSSVLFNASVADIGMLAQQMLQCLWLKREVRRPRTLGLLMFEDTNQRTVFPCATYSLYRV